MRKQVLWDEGWLFHEGEIPMQTSSKKSFYYIQAKTERYRQGPASIHYMDETEYYDVEGPVCGELWEKVTLPHDYTIRQTPCESNNEALGFFTYENAWYRKHFALDLEEGTRVRVYFEGAAIHSTIYVNGCYMMSNRCGYNSFEVDITDAVDFHGENVIAVHIDNSEHEGWWYEGAGIYRHVWLDISDAISVDRYGVFVHPCWIADKNWDVCVDTEIRNDGFSDALVNIRNAVLSPNGALVSEYKEILHVPARKHAVLKQSGLLYNPALWDIADPKLHTMVTEVWVAGHLADRQETRFGFRTAHFDTETGFYLNGRSVKIKGVCCHQDYGLTGRAVPERVQRYRLELMKEMGANGYRCAHYPQHACTMDMLDELGFLVLSETRWYDTTPEGIKQLEMLIKRDRNHPSVILWSMGNEEPLHLTDAGRRIAQTMLHRVRELDGTRPVTTAVSNDPLHCKVTDIVDVMGVNYNIEQWGAIHRTYPNVPFISTECCATGTTRGWYMPDTPSRGYIYGYDHDVNKSFRSREFTWRTIMDRPWIAGGYQWAGIEHRGEAAWPRLCSQSGAVDLFLNRKDAFYQNQSHWTGKPMVHLLPHWNWEGREGELIDVWAYTNCSVVELYLNDQMISRQEVEHYGHAAWKVPYTPGKLVAVGYQLGIEVCRDVTETTGRPAALRLKLESDGVRADGRDVAIITCDCVDESGRHVPDAAPFVSFDSSSLGYIEATGSDVSDHIPVYCPDRRMRAGLISVLGRAGTEPGEWKIYAHAEGLKSAVLTITLR